MSTNRSEKKYWFIKQGHRGIGFGAIIGYPNTWQGVLFWVFCLVSLVSIPKYIDNLQGTRGLGVLAFVLIVMLVWFPVTAIKTKYGTEDNKDDLNI